MPEVSRFFGIVVAIYYNDHPPPHFHARYGEQKAIVDIATFEMIEGGLSRRALDLVREWAGLHQAELEIDWELARRHQPLNPIPPLE